MPLRSSSLRASGMGPSVPRRVRSGLPFGASTGNRLIANTVLGDGHYYDPEFERGDGIRVLSPDTFLSGNVANNFAGYGISAVEGVISGVNYASGNGNPAHAAT